jgi:hypothetical protein
MVCVCVLEIAAPFTWGRYFNTRVQVAIRCVAAVVCVSSSVEALHTHREVHAHMEHWTSSKALTEVAVVAGKQGEFPTVSSSGVFATSADLDEYMKVWRQTDILGVDVVNETVMLTSDDSLPCNYAEFDQSKHGSSRTPGCGVCARINFVSDSERSIERLPPAPATNNTEAKSDPHYVFIAGGAYTGTTGLLGLLSSSPEVSNLCGAGTICCEGSWLLINKGLVDMKIRNDPRYPKDWRKALDIFSNYWDLSKPVLVDKSPDYLGRFSRIWQDLGPTGAKVSFIYLVASPCYFLSSPTLRHGSDRAALMSDWRRIVAIMKGEVTKLRAAGANVIVLKAENIIGDPHGVASKLLDFIPELRSVDPTQSGVGGAPYVESGQARSQSAYEFANASDGKRYIGDFSGAESDTMSWLGYTDGWLARTPWVGEDLSVETL